MLRRDPRFAGVAGEPRPIEDAGPEHRSEAPRRPLLPAWLGECDYSERRSAQGLARAARRPAWRPAAAMRRAVSAAGPR